MKAKRLYRVLEPTVFCTPFIRETVADATTIGRIMVTEILQSGDKTRRRGGANGRISIRKMTGNASALPRSNDIWELFLLREVEIQENPEPDESFPRGRPYHGELAA